MPKDQIRVGGASGYWGDASLATPQLLAEGGLDFIVYDYLAEITMAILARVRAKSPDLGYATDFVTAAMAPNLAEIAKQGVRIISNAGGMNPEGCAEALRQEITAQGLSLRVSVVSGDDLMPELDSVVAQSPRDMGTNQPLPQKERITSANAYLGAFPIARALDQGADIVITGRCVDSAVTLGACIHAFGWDGGDLDLLAAGSLAGHLIECGTQATGGNFTDWHLVAESLHDAGYPIAEITADGKCTLTKPAGTGGMVSTATVAEQMLYEIGDPQAYILPDVVCDLSQVELTQTGADRVQVTGARGRGVPDSLKACLTYADGWRGGHMFTFYGIDAEAKASCFAETVLKRTRRQLMQANAPDFTATSTELLGAESQFGTERQAPASREVVAKIAVRHSDPKGVGLFLKEATGLGLTAPPGLSGFAGTRPKPSPVLALFSCLVPKASVQARVDGVAVDAAPPRAIAPVIRPEPPAAMDGDTVFVPLLRLAFARSGDKGDSANIGVIARDPALVPWIWHGLSDAHLRRVFGHFLTGEIDKWLLPGTGSLNILMTGVLDGGGTSSLRNDPQGKGYAQLLLASEILVGRNVVEGLT